VKRRQSDEIVTPIDLEEQPYRLVCQAIINSLPSGPDPGYRGENPEEAGRAWNYL